MVQCVVSEYWYQSMVRCIVGEYWYQLLWSNHWYLLVVCCRVDLYWYQSVVYCVLSISSKKCIVFLCMLIQHWIWSCIRSFLKCVMKHYSMHQSIILYYEAHCSLLHEHKKDTDTSKFTFSSSLAVLCVVLLNTCGAQCTHGSVCNLAVCSVPKAFHWNCLSLHDQQTCAVWSLCWMMCCIGLFVSQGKQIRPTDGSILSCTVHQ